VVIGFLIALWLAPILERWILAFFASLVTVPLAFVAFMALWQFLRRYDWAKHETAPRPSLGERGKAAITAGLRRNRPKCSRIGKSR
jgi:hypothetical protein